MLLITIDGISEDFPLANKDEIVSNGDLIIRSNGISEYSGGASGLYLNGNSSTGEGTVIVKRGTKGKTNKNIFMPIRNSFLFNTTATIIIFVLAMPDAFYMIKIKLSSVQMDI